MAEFFIRRPIVAMVIAIVIPVPVSPRDRPGFTGMRPFSPVTPSTRTVFATIASNISGGPGSPRTSSMIARMISPRGALPQLAITRRILPPAPAW